MPLYEYECKKCHHRFERIQKYSDPHVKKCPDCGGAVEQVVSAPAVQFKGSGWYVTDYAKKSTGSGSSSSNGDSRAGDSGSNQNEKKESKSESSKSESSRSESSRSESSGSESSSKSDPSPKKKKS
ncbi:MAG TPA: zinc ribbon domain-containing protein [Terriglobales bacterium]|nr:zinc ribbon domain-containing protein [Terriglobales bacterium]